MAALLSFRALRPTADAARLVAAVPYDVVSTDEARALAAGNPLSFLHVSRAEIDLPPTTDPYSDAVYTAAASRFEALKRDAPLVREQVPSLYVYRLQGDRHQQFGIAGCYALDEYDSGVIKKHERTRSDKEDDRTRHMLALRAQTGPVFLTYRASAEIDTLVSGVAAMTPLFDFGADDGVRHTIWRPSSNDTHTLIAAFGRVPTLYIADGHHRAASAARTRQALHGARRAEAAGSVATAVAAPGTLPCDVFLAVAFPDNQVHILPYNRIVKDLNGLTGEMFLAEVKARFDLSPGTPAPSRKGEIAMYLAGRWYTLRVRPESSPRADAVASLDVSVLQSCLLDQVLAIHDVRTDPRIDFVGGARSVPALEQAVDAGRAAVAFSMFPVRASELMAVADAGLTMPPKSTWFEPKPRDGLLIHEI
jgi:uncharacterized protein (DUF1015 family)